MTEVTNQFMIPFFKLFGVEVGNGLSPFVTNIDTPNDLITRVSQLFRPARCDTRGTNSISLAVDNKTDDISAEED